MVSYKEFSLFFLKQSGGGVKVVEAVTP